MGKHEHEERKDNKKDGTKAFARSPIKGSPGAVIRKSLLRQIFCGAYMQRWNDKLRPCQLAELDKQAHKMIVASILWTRACAGLPEDKHYALGQEIVEGALFDYFFRTVTTDIKPPLFYRILEDPGQYEKLSAYVFRTLAPVLSPLEPFWERFRIWHTEEGSYPRARRILRAAHLFASRWEFKLIEPLNGFDHEMPSIAWSFDKELGELKDVAGMPDILNPGTALSQFANFSGQLRFQVRWTQIPRIPQTDVLGHMFFVASLAYLYSLAIGACRARLVNNFFCGLFHDLPELLTRDIITPVKRSSNELAQLIRAIEDEELMRRIVTPLENDGQSLLVSRLRYYLGLDTTSEFSERIMRDGKVFSLASFDELDKNYDQDRFHPLDGTMVKACDMLGAYLEADESIRNGVSSRTLVEARMRLAASLSDVERVPRCMYADSLLADFD